MLWGIGKVTKPLGASVFSGVKEGYYLRHGVITGMNRDEVCQSEGLAHWEFGDSGGGFFALETVCCNSPSLPPTQEVRHC